MHFISSLSLVFATLGLIACDKSEASATAPQVHESAAPVAPAAVEGRLVEITAGDGGFTPSTIPAKKGETLTLRFKRTTKSDCLKAVEFADLGVKKDLPLDTPVDIVVKADKPGTIVFQCWMKMVGGKIVVSDS